MKLDHRKPVSNDIIQIEKMYEEELFKQRMEIFEYFRTSFEQQKKEIEEAYKAKNQPEEEPDDRIFDYTTELVRDASTFTGDYFKSASLGVDTSTYNGLSI